MNERILLAYSGSLASSAAVAWLAERHGAEVVTVTLDVGQTDDLDEVRARALACGAVRAHVIDAGDAFARDYVIPALRGAASGEPMPLATLTHRPIARALAEVGAIEAADAVAHASRAASIDAAVAAVDPALRVLAPARAWDMDDAALVTITDGHPLALEWLGSVRGHRVQALGVESFGQSGDLPDLYRAYRLDTDAILDACATALLKR